MYAFQIIQLHTDSAWCDILMFASSEVHVVGVAYTDYAANIRKCFGMRSYGVSEKIQITWASAQSCWYTHITVQMVHTKVCANFLLN